MCGIAGIVGGRDRPERQVIDEMTAVLAHRGPDGQDIWRSADGQTCLGHRRLAIIDLSPAAAQPMADATGRLHIVFNGEIYNYLELRAELAARGHAFRTSSDTEVLLAAFAEWGGDCLQRLNGMFAFAVWDDEKRTLFAARDRFGEKPFYYHHAPGLFVFASEIKALLAHPAVPRRIDERGVAQFLAVGLTDAEPTTCFHGVSQLPAAHRLALSGDDLRIEPYWRLREPAAPPQRSPAELVAEFRDLFLDSVRLRLRSDVPLGTSLSGGLDSSAVVGAVRSLLAPGAPPQQTFSARMREALDEGPFIDAVRARGGVAGHDVWLDAERLPEQIDRLVWHQEQPFTGSSQFAQYEVMDLARRHGVVVLLDGQGADEELGGYHPPSFGGRYAGLLRRGRWIALGGEILAYRRRHGRLPPALRHLGAALLPDRLWVRAKLLDEGSAAVLDGKLLARFHDSFVPPALPGFSSPLKRELHRMLTFSSLPTLLRYADRNSMAFSREVRLPFLDHRLVEHVFALPDELLVDRGVTKVALRRAGEGLMPELVRNRMDKLGFAPPEAIWLRGPLRGWMTGVLAGAAARPFFRRGAVAALRDRFLAGWGSSGLLFRILCFEMWLRRFGLA